MLQDLASQRLKIAEALLLLQLAHEASIKAVPAAAAALLPVKASDCLTLWCGSPSLLQGVLLCAPCPAEAAELFLLIFSSVLFSPCMQVIVE